jgi:hypothetical protein|tara:strand:- start:61 stop:750 length:690 start_codon:yes stop_codon:yes gene_type:complete
MPTINASKYGFMSNSTTGTGAFTNARNASSASGTAFNQPTGTQTTTSFNIGFSSKGDSATLKRSWWAFDVSTYASGYTITDLQIQFDPTTNTSTNYPIAIVASTAQGNADSNLTQADWNNLEFGTLYGGSSSTYWPDSNSVSTIDLNSTAVSAFSTSYLKMCILWYYDYSGAGSLVTTNGNAYQNYNYVPRITFSAAASGYTKEVNGISSYSKVNGLAKSDISKVNGVE